MAKLIKTDRFNYFCTKDTNDRIAAYDEKNKNIMFVMSMPDHSKLIVPPEKINLKYGGQIYFEYDGEIYYIDDGYRDTLIKTGYIVYNQYDESENHINDTMDGIRLRDLIKEKINISLKSMQHDFKEVENSEIITNNNQLIYKFKSNYFSYTVYIDTVNGIVNKNQQRKLNNLPFYPFDKNMDKYGTYYVSIFCKKITEDKLDEQITISKYQLANEFITKFMDTMNYEVSKPNSFHFKPLFNKRRKIINWKGI